MRQVSHSLRSMTSAVTNQSAKVYFLLMQRPLHVCRILPNKCAPCWDSGTQAAFIFCSTMRGTESLGRCSWSLPRFCLAVALSTEAHSLLAGFSLLSLTWRGAWRLWGASEMMVGNIASAHWHFGDGCGEGLTEGPRS